MQPRLTWTQFCGGAAAKSGLPDFVIQQMPLDCDRRHRHLRTFGGVISMRSSDRCQRLALHQLQLDGGVHADIRRLDGNRHDPKVMQVPTRWAADLRVSKRHNHPALPA